MLKDGVIYDTSLMLLIDENYAYEFLGYKELKRDNPSKDRIYNCAAAGAIGVSAPPALKARRIAP